VPTVVNAVTGRGYVFLGEDNQARLLRFLISPLYRILLRSSQVGLIFENQTDRDYFINQRLVRSNQTWLIESVGVDPDRFRPQPEVDGVPVILMPARMLWDKGVGILVQAARLLKTWQISARVVLAGPLDTGNPSAIPEDTILAWQEEGVLEWVGRQENMEKIYAESHIVTLPSFHEGLPTVLIEAASCGRPLVATDIPGCRAVITPDENGILVPPGDVQALAKALVRLVQSPKLRQQMGRAARQRVLDKFTYQQVNAATINVYRHYLT
jgi:glycosyltransferase involved in cell wall biosynthesis